MNVCQSTFGRLCLNLICSGLGKHQRTFMLIYCFTFAIRKHRHSWPHRTAVSGDLLDPSFAFTATSIIPLAGSQPSRKNEQGWPQKLPPDGMGRTTSTCLFLPSQQQVIRKWLLHRSKSQVDGANRSNLHVPSATDENSSIRLLDHYQINKWKALPQRARYTRLRQVVFRYTYI